MKLSMKLSKLGLLALVAGASAQSTTTTTGAPELRGDLVSDSASGKKGSSSGGSSGKKGGSSGKKGSASPYKGKKKGKKAPKLSKGGKYLAIDDPIVQVIVPPNDENGPSCDVESNEWYWKNEQANTKINWYFYTAGVIGGPNDQVSDLNTYWVKMTIFGDAAPWIGLYTQPEGDAQDAASWHRTRLQFEKAYSTPSLWNADEEIVFYINDMPTTDDFSVLTGDETYISLGTIADAQANNFAGGAPQFYSSNNQDGNIQDDDLLLIALASDSGQAAGRQDWIVHSAGFEIEGSGPKFFRTTCNGKGAPQGFGLFSAMASGSASSVATMAAAGILVVGVALLTVRRKQYNAGYHYVEESLTEQAAILEIDVNENTPLVEQSALLEV